MLKSLHISNYALIESVDIEFGSGLNIITGETGAGKSIMLGALSLILGGRADSRVVRDHGVKSVIEAEFDIEGYSGLKDFCLANDIEWDDRTCILRREITPSGRSRAFINDSPVPLTSLRGVALFLVDIHSQHQNLLLAQPEFQTRILDTLAGNATRLEVHRKRFEAFRQAMKRLKATKLKLERDRQDEEYTRFQYEQLEELRLIPGEQDELEQRRDMLMNISEIKGALEVISNSLAEGSGNAADAVSAALDASRGLGNVLPKKADIPARLEGLSVEIADIAATAAHINDSLSADPAEIEAIDQRLGSIYDLEHKHRVETVDELIAIRDRLGARLGQLDDSDELLKTLEKEARQARALARESAAEITKARSEQAEVFARRLKEVAMPLGMKNLQCEIRVSPADLSASGADAVEFLFAFNKNQTPMPVGQTASGGEISRLMLCVKSIIASRMELPSIIFDEIDTGVSGDVANRMGLMMRDLAADIQVIAITHLPQVAAKGSMHYKVYKEDDERSTYTRISRLDDDEREREIAVMLSGSAVSEEARANARALLNQN